MKVTIAILFIILATFSGRPGMVAQTPQAKYNQIVLPIKIANDSLEIKYFEEIKKTDKLTDQLIAKTKTLQENNVQLYAEIKRLKKANDFLRNNIDTVYVRDTVFKKRKIYQIFKN